MESDQSSLTAAVQDLADEFLTKKKEAAALTTVSPASRRVPYSPEAMVQLMIEHPEWTHAQFALHFGRQPSWISSVLASQAFQDALDPHRHLVADPSLTATMEERFRMLALRAVTVLGEKLNVQNVSDLVVLKSAEIGVKALGLGIKPVEAAPQLPQNTSQTVAEKLLAAMDARDAELQRKRTVDVETVEVRDSGK